MKKIKVNDTVKVINGKDKGKTGEVVKIFPNENRIVIKGINIITKHQKQSANHKGGLIKVEGPVNMSKVMLVCPFTGKPTRVKFEIDKESGKKYRVSVKAGKRIEN